MSSKKNYFTQFLKQELSFVCLNVHGSLNEKVKDSEFVSSVFQSRCQTSRVQEADSPHIQLAMPQLEDGRPRGVVVCAGGRQQVHKHQAGPADREAAEGHCQEGGWQVSHPQAFEDRPTGTPQS